MPVATGAESLLGVLVNGPSPNYDIGQPGLDPQVCAAPAAAPSVAAGAAGNITCDALLPNYCAAYRIRGGHRTNPGPSARIAGGLSAKKASLTSIPTSADARVDAREIYRSEVIEATAPVVTLAGTPAAGLCTNGVHRAGVAFLVDGVLSDVTYTDDVTVTDNGTNGKLDWASIATYSGSGNCTARYLYLSKAGETTLKLAAIIADNVTTTYANMSIADASLGADAPAWSHYYLVWTLWDNTTATHDDDIAFASTLLDLAKTPTPYNETGVNWGLLFIDPDSYDVDADFTVIQPQGISAAAGEPDAVPGPIKLSGTTKKSMRIGPLVPELLAGMGDMTRTAVAGEPTRIFSGTPTIARRTPHSLTLLSYKGSEDVPPIFLLGQVVTGIDFTIANGKLVDVATKLEGANFSRVGPATKASGSGTYPYTFVASGLRSDAVRDTKSLLIKITQGLSAGTYKIKPKVTDGTDYSHELTGYANTASDRQTKGGGQYDDGLELTDADGNVLGYFVESNRLPLLLRATGPLTGIAVDDIYELPCTIPIPGIGDAPYTGCPPTFALTPHLTDAHVTLKKGSAVVEAMSATVKFGFPKKITTGLGAGARTPLDIRKDTYWTLEITFTRQLRNEDWLSAIRDNERFTAIVDMTGPLIKINPGVYSTYHEALVATATHAMATVVKSAVSGTGIIDEQVTVRAKQPVNRAYDLYSLLLTTPQDWAWQTA